MDHRNTSIANARDVLLYDPMEEKAIGQLAYTYREKRGKPIGSPHEDWFRAEQEIKRRRNWQAAFGHEPAFSHEH
jgi:hypothetical protein